MGLSGSASGGANTNLTGLSPEQIADISRTNVAGGGLAQNSIQNIFENVQKMAYSDYLDRLPQDKAFAEKFRTPLEGSDGWYYDYNPQTKKWEKTDVPVSKKKLEYGPTGGFPNVPVIVYNPQTQQPEVQSFDKGTGAVKPTVPKGQPPPISAEAQRKQAETEAKEDKRVAELDTIIQGLKIDKDSQNKKKFVASTQSHIDEFNAKASTPYIYSMDEVTTPTLGGFSSKTEIKPVKRDLPPGITASMATKAYKLFLKSGRTGEFDDFVYELQQGKIQLK